jgi:hypothetical protein
VILALVFKKSANFWPKIDHATFGRKSTKIDHDYNIDPREKFAELFDEKAHEVNKLESEFADCRRKLEATNRKLVDSEYKGDIRSRFRVRIPPGRCQSVLQATF